MNCTQLWETFSVAAQTNNFQVTDANYNSFFEIANFSTPKDGILFWSGNQVFIFLILIFLVLYLIRLRH